MGDRTAVRLHVYNCPPEQTWAIAKVIETYEPTEYCGQTYGGNG